jgi:hypothetical protein
VKTVLSIICCLTFALAQLAACAQTPQASVAKMDCGCGGKMACCSTQPAPVSQPLTANPVPAGNQNQLSVPPQNLVAWVLPDAALPGFSPVASTLFPAPDAALYARDCAWLI